MKRLEGKGEKGRTEREGRRKGGEGRREKGKGEREAGEGWGKGGGRKVKEGRKQKRAIIVTINWTLAEDCMNTRKTSASRLTQLYRYLAQHASCSSDTSSVLHVH